MGNAKSRSQNRERSSSMDEACNSDMRYNNNNVYGRHRPKCRCKDESASNDQQNSSNDEGKNNDDNDNIAASLPLCYCPPAQGLPLSKFSNKKSTTKKSTAKETSHDETSSDESSTDESSAAESTNYSYPEFPPACCGIYYVQCPMCCQVYPSCCTSCPNCGHTPRPPGNGEVEMPASAYCPCCRQEAPKANGLQHLCTPCPCPCACSCVCCVCPDESANNQTQCIQLPPTCCHCCCQTPLIYICDNPKSRNCCNCNKDKCSTKKKVTHCTCDSDVSTDESAVQCCKCDTERRRSSSPPKSETASRMREKSTRKTQYKQERHQRSSVDQSYGESFAGGSSGERECSPIYGKAHCPCGCEVDIKNITFQLPVCNDEDDD